MANEKDFIASLETLEMESDGGIVFSAVDPAEIPIGDQLKLFSTADLLMAPHGASLTWLVLQPPTCSQVIEFKATGNYHYENLAHYAGVSHRFLEARPPMAWGSSTFNANVPGAVEAVVAAKANWEECVKEIEWARAALL